MTKQTFPINERIIKQRLSMPSENIDKPLWMNSDLNLDIDRDRYEYLHHQCFQD